MYAFQYSLENGKSLTATIILPITLFVFCLSRATLVWSWVLDLKRESVVECMDFDPVLPPTATAEDRPGPDAGSQPWLLIKALEDSYGNAPGAKSL